MIGMNEQRDVVAAIDDGLLSLELLMVELGAQTRDEVTALD